LEAGGGQVRARAPGYTYVNGRVRVVRARAAPARLAPTTLSTAIKSIARAFPLPLAPPKPTLYNAFASPKLHSRQRNYARIFIKKLSVINGRYRFNQKFVD
jgi:hypothetical protein